jgi:hypothetical protein
MRASARHHRVPRFYLERFANERMQITTVDRRTRAQQTAAIRETAAEKDFHTATWWSMMMFVP